MKKMMWVFMAMAVVLVASPAFAQETTTTAGTAATSHWVSITAGFAMAFAVGLAALAQSRVAAAACEGLARNPAARPGLQLALILGLAFIESLVLFTLVIIFVKVKVQ